MLHVFVLGFFMRIQECFIVKSVKSMLQGFPQGFFFFFFVF